MSTTDSGIPMIHVDDVTAMHGQMIARWHERDVDNPCSGFLHIACEQCARNFLLWHQEDVARSPVAKDREIAAVKRRIDVLNQQRNDLIEVMDDWIAEALRQTLVVPKSDAAINTETPGSAIDRLAILALRIYHLREQTQRRDVTLGHICSVRQKLAVCKQQHQDLSEALTRLLDDLYAGRKRHKTYHQFKMYNDPSLNPCVYGNLQQPPPARSRSA